MKTLISKLVYWVSRKENLTKEQEAIIAYGLDIFISTFITTICVVGLGLAFGDVIVAIIYLLTSIPIRSNGGGYHAKTHWGCTLLQCISFSIVYLTPYFLPESSHIISISIIGIFSLLIILLRAPVEHPNNPLHPKYRLKMKIRCIFWTIIAIISSGVMHYTILMKYCLYPIISILVAIISLFIKSKAEVED